MASEVRHFTTQGGGEVPSLAYGTAHVHDPEIIKTALAAGYRHIDTAVLYRNHHAVRQAIQQSGLPRKDIFVTTKVSFQGKGNERGQLQQALADLGIAQVDLCLLHTPFSGNVVELLCAYLPHRMGRFQPLAWKPMRVLAAPTKWFLRKLLAIFGLSPAQKSAVRTSAWKELEAAQRAGECRFIGVSNYDMGLLAELEHTASVLPAVNQIELHPRYQARDVISFCHARGIAVYGYGNGISLDLKQAAVISASRNKQILPAQISIAWTLQAGVGVVVRSSHEARMRQNLDALAIRLTDDEVAAVDQADEKLPFYWDVSVISREIG